MNNIGLQFSSNHPNPRRMRFLFLFPSFLSLVFSASSLPPSSPSLLSPHQSITSTITSFFHALDTKNESLVRTLTTPTITFDASAFSSLGFAFTAPLVGRDTVAPAVIAAVHNLTTSHNLSNLRIKVQGDKDEDVDDEQDSRTCPSTADAAFYVLAWHWRRIQEDRAAPGNVYLMSNRYEVGLVREGGNWAMEVFRIFPIFQMGNKEVMGMV